MAEHDQGPDVDVVYEILKRWVRVGKKTYTDLSNEYCEATKVWHEPHGSWDIPLGTINLRLAAIGAPAISALVTLASTGEPGGNFWGCAPNVPSRPSTAAKRTAEWVRIVGEVTKYKWPTVLP